MKRFLSGFHWCWHVLVLAWAVLSTAFMIIMVKKCDGITFDGDFNGMPNKSMFKKNQEQPEENEFEKGFAG